MEFNKDLYGILGVKKGATETEIRNAYRKLAKKHHPDVNQGNKDAEQRFKEINLAYEVLKDPQKRSQYDQMRAMGGNPFARRRAGGGSKSTGPFGSDVFGDIGLGDLFEEIFGGGGFGTTRGRQGAFYRRGGDRETQLTISFLDAARGGERVFELADGRRLSVKIPEGVDSGSKIRLAGQGDAGMGGAPNGDLIITVEMLPHPYFVREGNNILLRLPISFSEAVLGSEVDVPTLDGKVVLTVPKGISSGQRLKFGGKGIRSSRTGKRGDQFVELLIKIPKDPDNIYRESAERLKDSDFEPREDLF